SGGEQSDQQVATEARVGPAGYVSAAYGYAHRVYGGLLSADEGTSYPLDSPVTNSPATGAQPPVEQPTVAIPPSDPFPFHRRAAVDPGAQWAFGGDDEGGSRAESRQVSKERKRRRSGIALAISLVLFGGVAYYVYNEVIPSLRPEPTAEAVAADDFPGPGTGSVEIVIEP